MQHTNTEPWAPFVRTHPHIMEIKVIYTYIAICIIKIAVCNIMNQVGGRRKNTLMHHQAIYEKKATHSLLFSKACWEQNYAYARSTKSCITNTQHVTHNVMLILVCAISVIVCVSVRLELQSRQYFLTNKEGKLIWSNSALQWGLHLLHKKSATGH